MPNICPATSSPKMALRWSDYWETFCGYSPDHLIQGAPRPLSVVCGRGGLRVKVDSIKVCQVGYPSATGRHLTALAPQVRNTGSRLSLESWSEVKVKKKQWTYVFFFSQLGQLKLDSHVRWWRWVFSHSLTTSKWS